MKLTKLEKKIISFSYPLQQKPGYIKRKSLLHYLKIDELDLDKAINRLILHKYIKKSKKRTSHSGLCYELTKNGIKLWKKNNKSFVEKHWKWLIGAIIVPVLLAILQFASSDYNNTNGSKSPIINDSINTTINYNDSENPNYLNERKDELKGLSIIETVEKYFSTQNSNKFSLACALFPRIKCDSANGENISDFSRERMKYINGFEDIKIWEPEIKNNQSKIICTKYSYLLKSDSNPNRVTEIFSFYLDKREDNEWEITSRVCEKKFKEGLGVRECPIPASKKYCI